MGLRVEWLERVVRPAGRDTLSIMGLHRDDDVGECRATGSTVGCQKDPVIRNAGLL